MRYFVTLQGRTFEVELGGAQPRIDGVEVEAELASIPGGTLRSLRLNGASFSHSIRAGDRKGEWSCLIGGREIRAEVVDERTRMLREMTGVAPEETELTLKAPMPGLVLRVEVAVGDRVTAGQGVVIVEAMKMENELKAPRDGVVAKVEVEAGQTVDKGAVLLVLAP